MYIYNGDYIHPSRCMIPSYSSVCQALFEELVHQNVTDKQWIANDAWVTYGAVSVPCYIPSLAGTIGFALRKADIPGLGAFLAHNNTRLSSPNSDPFIKELWEELFGCSPSADLGGTMCSGSEVIGELIFGKTTQNLFYHLKYLSFQFSFFCFTG